VVGTPVDHLSAPNTEGDHELVARDDDTSDDGRSRLRLVHGDSDGESANTDTSDETTDSMLIPSVLRCDFDDGTDTGPEGGSRDGHAATDGVAKVTGNQSTNQTSNREKTSDCSLSSSAEFVSTVSVGFAKAGAVVVHEEVSRNLTTSVSEEKAAKRCCQAHKASQEGDMAIGIGSLSALEMLALGGMLLAFRAKELHIEEVN